MCELGAQGETWAGDTNVRVVYTDVRSEWRQVVRGAGWLCAPSGNGQPQSCKSWP